MDCIRSDAKKDSKLAAKLSELEEKMKSLQQSLMDEKLKLNRERGDELPEDWASMNRLHLPQCPLAKNAESAVKKASHCPIHGNAVRPNGLNSRSLPHIPTKQQNSALSDVERYSKLICEAEKFSQLESFNEKFHELYSRSMFSPTLYRPRVQSQENTSVEKELEGRLVRFAHDSTYDLTRDYATNNKTSSDLFDEQSITKNSSTDNSNDENCSEYTCKEENNKSEDESSANMFNPFDAIDSVRNKLLDIENFVNEASVKTRIK